MVIFNSYVSLPEGTSKPFCSSPVFVLQLVPGPNWTRTPGVAHAVAWPNPWEMTQVTKSLW